MNRVELEFKSDPADMDWHEQIATRLLPLPRAAGLADAELTALHVALVEAVNNIIEHAYAMQPGGSIVIQGECKPHELCFALQDEGIPMPLPLPTGELPDLDADGGRGWLIIRHSFPEIRYERRGHSNLLTLCRPLAAGG